MEMFHLSLRALCSITAAAAKSLQSCLTLRPHRWQPTRLPHPWDSPGKNTGVGCHLLRQCMKVRSESEVARSCRTLSDPMDCSPPGSSIHGMFQARVLEWGAIAFSLQYHNSQKTVEDSGPTHEAHLQSIPHPRFLQNLTFQKAALEAEPFPPETAQVSA